MSVVREDKIKILLSVVVVGVGVVVVVVGVGVVDVDVAETSTEWMLQVKSDRDFWHQVYNAEKERE